MKLSVGMEWRRYCWRILWRVLISYQPIVSYTRFLILPARGGVAYISLKKKAHQPAVLNIIWALVAIIAITRLLQ